MRLSLSWVVTQVNRVLASLSSAVPGPPEAKSTSNDSHIPYPHTSRPVHNQGSFPDADVFDFPTGEGPSIISQHEVTMEDMCATHNGWSCLVHDQGSLPDIDHHDFLTGGGPSTEVERPPCIDPRSSNFSGYDAFNPYQLPTSDPQSGTSVEGPYLLDPQSQYPPHPTTYCVPDGNHPGAFNRGHNSAYLSDTVPGQSRPSLTIDVSGIGHQVAPSLPSASTDTAVCLSAIEQYVPASLPPSPQKYAPSTQHVVSPEAANRRRKKVPSHFCIDCGAAFTSSHNLRYHYDSKHKGELNYPCKYYEQGCKYRAAAPRTATRHSLTCKARPD